MTKNLDPQGRDCQSLQRLTLVLCNQFKDFEREKLGCARCLVWGIILEVAICLVVAVGCGSASANLDLGRALLILRSPVRCVGQNSISLGCAQ